MPHTARHGGNDDDDGDTDTPGYDGPADDPPKNESGPIVPDWFSSWLPSEEPSWWGTAKDWLKDPSAHVRKVIFGGVLTGIAWFVEPVLNAIEMVFLGSNPQEFAAAGEQYGIADLPVVAGQLVGDVLAIPVDIAFAIPVGVLEDFLFGASGPFDALLITGVAVGIGVVFARYGPLVLRSALEAIPVIGGPLATLLGGAD